MYSAERDSFICRGQCAAGACPLSVCTRTGRPRAADEVLMEPVIEIGRRADAAAAPLGVAVDIGTTTIEVLIVDLATGEMAASGSCRNAQGKFGADVISRIEYVRANPGGVRQLQQVAANQVRQLIEACLAAASCTADDLVSCVTVGNTTMLLLAAGLSPASLGAYPFRPMSLFGGEVSSAVFGFGGSCSVYFAPCVSAFVGADVLAGAAFVLHQHPDGSGILIDLGTNGEIVAWHDGQIAASATAAGPVFEGGNISCGMPAVRGAVRRVTVDGGRLSLETVAGSPPVGLCGSGIIDAAAEAVRIGAVDPSGAVAAGGAFVRDGAIFLEDEVFLNQRDIREVQTAKAAVCAGAETLLAEIGTDPDNLDVLYLAGGLGSAADPKSAQYIGLVPKAKHITAAGNTALRGAAEILLHHGARERAEDLAERIRPIDLAVQPAFSARFVENMTLRADDSNPDVRDC